MVFLGEVGVGGGVVGDAVAFVEGGDVLDGAFARTAGLGVILDGAGEDLAGLACLIASNSLREKVRLP